MAHFVAADEPELPGVSRRRFLQGAGALGLATWLEMHAVPMRVASADPAQPSLTLHLVRREDMVDLRYAFSGVKLQGGSLVRDPAVTDARQVYVNVTFPAAQAIDEAASAAAVGTPAAAQAGPIPAYAAATRAQVGFNLADVLPIPLDSEHLLDWRKWELRVDIRSSEQDWFSSPVFEPVQAPAADVTALEVVTDLVFSPAGTSRFASSTRPVTHDADVDGLTLPYTETWHARLASGALDASGRLVEPVADPTAPVPAVAAIWSSVYGQADTTGTDFAGNDANGNSWRSSINDNDRNQIVDNSSNWVEASRNNYDRLPVPIPAPQFMLSPQGAILELSGKWDSTAIRPSFASYEHRSWLGRDFYVQTARRGYLLPFGHRATHITITRREFDVEAAPAGGGPAEVKAILAQYSYVIVNQRTRTFGDATKQQPDGTLWGTNDLRVWPLRSVTLRTLASPAIDTPAQAGPLLASMEGPSGTVSQFFPTIDKGSTDVLWTCDALDWNGNKVAFSTPLLFLEGQYAGDDASHANFAALVSYYNSVTQTRRNVNLAGQRLTIAQPTAKDSSPGSTTVETAAMELRMGGASASHDAVVANAQVPLWPVLGSAKVTLSQTRGLGAQGGASPVTAMLPPAYTGPSFDPNAPVEGFLALVDKPPLGIGDVSKIGGLAVPNFTIKGLGRTLGAMGVDPMVALPDHVPSVDDYFPAGVTDALATAKLLGGLTLADLLSEVKALGAGAAQQFVAPLLRYAEDVTGYDPAKPPQLPAPPPTKYTIALSWVQPLGGVASGPSGSPAAGLFVGETGSTLSLDGTFTTDLLHPERSSALVVGKLTNAKINLIGTGALQCLILDFDHLTFTTGSGRKPTLDVGLRSVGFGGVLTFVNQLQEFLGTLGSPLAVDVAPSGVTASFSLALPTISVGVFTLANVSISIGASLPFTGAPARARFAFCSREHPFVLTVSFFGGGGFFGIGVGTDGLELLEASLEFGAQAAIDIGVASGGVSIMAGVYFKYDVASGAGAQLTGFLDLSGELEVLGLISISAEFQMQFQYDLGTNKVIGRATLTVEVSVLFFSTSVSLEVERRFGGGGDPDFADLYSSTDWSTYCSAFAAEVAA